MVKCGKKWALSKGFDSSNHDRGVGGVSSTCDVPRTSPRLLRLRNLKCPWLRLNYPALSSRYHVFQPRRPDSSARPRPTFSPLSIPDTKRSAAFQAPPIFLNPLRNTISSLPRDVSRSKERLAKNLHAREHVRFRRSVGVLSYVRVGVTVHSLNRCRRVTSAISLCITTIPLASRACRSRAILDRRSERFRCSPDRSRGCQ